MTIKILSGSGAGGGADLKLENHRKCQLRACGAGATGKHCSGVRLEATWTFPRIAVTIFRPSLPQFVQEGGNQFPA